ncbi:MAG: xanthine dehydrogenase molybdopterin binding subunit [Terrimicrobiaceae bacterium]
MSCSFSFLLNGEARTVTGLNPNVTLLQWLREAGLTAAKEGCAEGDCGACTVVVVEKETCGKRVFRTLNSCIALLPTLADKEVWTVEGMGAGGLHPVQKAMTECYGSQCGYCTPGFISSLFEGYYRDDIFSLEQLNGQLCGNLCRCTGYRPIRDAARLAWSEEDKHDAFSRLLERENLPPPPLDYEADGRRFFRPDSLPGFFSLVSKYPDARWIAGGTELGVSVAKTFENFPALIHLSGIPELHGFSVDAAGVTIGAGLALTDVMDRVRDSLPSLAEMLRWFASRPIRNRATLGGNLATASPIGDMAPVLLSLDATLLLASANGQREVPIDQFFTGYRKTGLQPGELLVAVKIPEACTTSVHICRAFKISKRREMDISIVSAGIAVELDSGGLVTRARLGFGGVAATPALATKTMAFLVGRLWNLETLVEAGRVLEGEFEPISDGRASSEYRSGILSGILQKCLCEEIEDPDLEALPPVTPTDGHRHESAIRHVTGSAVYVDDEAVHRGALVVWPVCSPHAHAKILRVDANAAKIFPGISAILLARDVPGKNDIGASRQDEILLADQEVHYVGQVVAAIVGISGEACREAEALLQIDYEPLDVVVTIEDALRQNGFLTEPSTISRGDVVGALGSAPLTLAGEFAFGGQEHFYLETQAAWAEFTEDDALLVHSSTQHPSEIQTLVARVLGWSRHQVVVQVPRMGGGFGGKETQGACVAALSALAALTTKKPCRTRWNRDQDFQITGKRHPFLARFEAGFDPDGHILALSVELFANGGWCLDLSQPICDRALFHLDNSYFLPAVRFTGRVCRTNLTSQTAFRGFGGPQGMLVIEEILDRISRQLGLAPEEVRERNLYRGSGETNTTHYGQEIGDNRIRRIWNELRDSSDFDGRKKVIAEFNSGSQFKRRGLAITPVKFGISFTHTPYNQAGALVHIYADGSIQVNHGGTEMGQGLQTKILGIAESELGVPASRIRTMHTRTDKIPNTSATAASSGSDLNGAAVADACRTLQARLIPVAVEMLAAKGDPSASAENLAFRFGKIIRAGGMHSLLFEDVVAQAYLRRISLSATGYYRTPEIHYDRAAGRGKPFYYFSCGAAASEVEVDSLTGAMRVLRVDILQDVGSSLNQGIDRGQIEGGFVQGMGWLTGEELIWNKQGHLLSHGASTYQIPAIGDVPADFRIALMKNAAQPGTIHGSKAVGEPPLMLAISVREAIREAVASFSKSGTPVLLDSPATGEAIFRAIRSAGGAAGTGITRGDVVKW